LVDVFISYSRTNQPVVRQLADAVKREGYSVWWDEELPPHLSYGDVITEKIGAAKAAIVVWSQDAAASEWVRAEADVARNQKKLIQTSIDERMPPMPFNQIQFASIGDWRGEDDHPGWMKVKASLSALCGPAGAAPPRVAAPPGPPPAPVARPAPSAGGRALLIPLLTGLLALAVLVAGYLLWSRGAAPAENRVEADNRAAPVPEPVPAQDARTEAPALTETEPATAEPEPDQVFPDSSRRRLSIAELEGLSLDQLRTARNEIFARHGRAFRDPALRRHFRRYRWYRERADEVALSPVEEANVRLLREAESR
jgi:TIR domain-containing protein/YARHG domain-containing protein